MSHPGGGLTDKFLGSDHGIKWGALGAALAGSGIYAVFIGFIEFGLSIGEAISLVVNRGTAVVGAQLGTFLDFFRRTLGNAWTGPWLDGGPFEIIISILPVLVVFGLLAWGVRRVT